MTVYLPFPERKTIRARVIADYVKAAGYKGVVCFSCGHASQALQDTGIYTLQVAPQGDLQTSRWWTPEMIHKGFPGLFNATSGDLPVSLMVRLAEAYKKYIGELKTTFYSIPTGSGETIICLSWVYPLSKFIALYGVGVGTEYDTDQPLNKVVSTLFEVERRDVIKRQS